MDELVRETYSDTQASPRRKVRYLSPKYSS